MDKRLVMMCAALMAFALAAPAADMSIEAEIDGLKIEGDTPERKPDKPRTNASCAAQCSTAHSRCGSEVRRARQQCSREAATGGQRPFETMTFDSAAFCAYFRRPRNCGPGCELRFARHFDMCLRAVDNNTAAMRHDCSNQERQAQNLCRDELRACEAACTRQ